MDLLKAANVWYVGDLVQRTESDLRDNRLSSSAVVEVRTALWAHRLDLKKGRADTERCEWSIPG